MQKKLLAAAVAGALVAPAAFAQSSVTISGYFKVGPDYVSYSGASGLDGTTPGQTAATQLRRAQANETRVSDHSSRILFNITESLGSGLSAIAQLDVRFNPSDSAYVAGQSVGSAFGGGNTWVGLRSTGWGTLTFGRHDLHYGKAGDDTASKAGSLQLIASGIFDYVGRPTPATTTAVRGTGAVGIAGTTRTNNVIRWDSPNWSGFAMTVAYSTQPLQASGASNVEGDLHLGTSGGATTGVAGTGGNAGTVITRRGKGWNFNPSYNAANWGVQYSYWTAKMDLNVAGSAYFVPVGTNPIQDDQKSHVLAGYIRMEGFKVGLAYNKSKLTNVASGLSNGERAAWSIPVTWTAGPHSIAGHYTRARDSKDGQIACSAAQVGVAPGCTAVNAIATVSGSGTGASMWAAAYDYSLSKRTSVGISYGELRNKANASYNFFYNSHTAFGSAQAGTLPGEKVRLLSGAVRHNF